MKIEATALNQRAEDITDAVIRLLEGEEQFVAQVYTMRIDEETPVHTPAVILVISNHGEKQHKLMHVFMLDCHTSSVPGEFFGRPVVTHRNASSAFDYAYVQQLMKQAGVRHHNMIANSEIMFEKVEDIHAKIDDVSLLDYTLIAEGLDLEKDFPSVFKNAILGITPLLARI